MQDHKHAIFNALIAKAQRRIEKLYPNGVDLIGEFFDPGLNILIQYYSCLNSLHYWETVIVDYGPARACVTQIHLVHTTL